MKLYLTSHGTYCGTQAEFYERQIAECGGKKSDYDASGAEVEVPTDKSGLIGYLNDEKRFVREEDHYTTVVERQDPPIEDEPGDAPQTLNLQYLQTFFDQAPLTLQGELAVRAVDQLVAAAPKLTAPPATSVDQLREEVASDDDLFQ